MDLSDLLLTLAVLAGLGAIGWVRQRLGRNDGDGSGASDSGSGSGEGGDGD